MTRSIVVAALLALISVSASAACTCRCMNGINQPICSAAYEVPPVCPPMACQIAPPAVAPIQAPMVPPPGTMNCQPQQVFNPYRNQYEWKTVCR